MRFFILSVLAFLLIGVGSAQDTTDYQYGLSFKSHLVNLDERTSLDLSLERPLTNLTDGFSIRFEVKLRQETQTFGYIFRMVVDEESSFDLLVNLIDHKFNFVINDRLGQMVASGSYVDPQTVVHEQWIPVEIQYFFDHTEIKIGKKSLNLKKGFDSFKHVEFYFGANKTKHFHTTEVPPITLRNVQIMEDGRKIRHWILARHGNNIVQDEVVQARAEVQNAVWEIDQHAEWRKALSLPLEGQPQIAFDERNGRIFIVEKDKIFIYSVAHHKLDTLKVVAGNPYWGVSRQIVYHPKDDVLLSYTIQSPVVYSFSFKTNSWSGSPTMVVDSRWHHNHLLDTSSNTLSMFMGYGYHKYNTGFMKLRLSDENPEWRNYTFNPTIHPRYLSAFGILDETHVLLLGGYGSKSGKQEEFPHNFYDLYKIDTETGANTKLWELNIDTPYIVFSNSMHVDFQKNQLYVLGYNNFHYKSKVSLYRFNIEGQNIKWQTYGSPLAFNFRDIESYCDLFYHEESNKLYALLAYKSEKDKYEVELYSIAYPVFTLDEIDQQTKKTGLFYFWLFFAVFPILLGTAYIFYRKKRKKNLDIEVEPKKAEVYVVEEKIEPEKEMLNIRLFNGFQFLGKDNIDYSGRFTPILKQIFLYLLLYSIKKQKGVSSYELDKTFWQGMPQDKAINNRSVNIRKLRILLTELGNIEIAQRNGYWILNINEDFVCDYSMVVSLLQHIEKDGQYTRQRIDEIITLSQGKLLPEVEHEWIDPFKTDFSSLLVKALLSAMTDTDIKANTELRLKIAEVILIHDSLEENAITYKCNLLYKLGQKGQSKHVFDKYCAEYGQILNTSPMLNYNDIILLDL